MRSDKLWAPWRINYIKNFKKQKGCLFCRVARSGQDQKNMVIFRSRKSIAVLNIFPYNNGHLMVTPVRHVRDLEQLSPGELTDLMDSLKKAKCLLDVTLKPQGFNIGINIGKISGAGIEKHLHIHIVPRWQGDTNFMPVIHNTKIISQSLNELYRLLKKNVTKRAGR